MMHVSGDVMRNERASRPRAAGGGARASAREGIYLRTDSVRGYFGMFQSGNSECIRVNIIINFIFWR